MIDFMALKTTFGALVSKRLSFLDSDPYEKNVELENNNDKILTSVSNFSMASTKMNASGLINPSKTSLGKNSVSSVGTLKAISISQVKTEKMPDTPISFDFEKGGPCSPLVRYCINVFFSPIVKNMTLSKSGSFETKVET
jgi:hypothetical protein